METSDKTTRYCTAKLCQITLFILSLSFLYLTISCYHFYMKGTPKNEKGIRIYDRYSPIYSAVRGEYPSSLPNMPAGFAIASAICMLGVGIIETAKVATNTNYIDWIK